MNYVNLHPKEEIFRVWLNKKGLERGITLEGLDQFSHGFQLQFKKTKGFLTLCDIVYTRGLHIKESNFSGTFIGKRPLEATDLDCMKCKGDSHGDCIHQKDSNLIEIKDVKSLIFKHDETKKIEVIF